MSHHLESLLDAQRRAECCQHDAELRTFAHAGGVRWQHPTPPARMVTTPAGITIGIAHQPRPPAMGMNAEQIQSALLEPRTAQPITGWRRLFGFFWRLA